MGAAHVDRIPPHRANGVKNARPHAFRRSAQHRGRPANARFGRPPREGGGVILYGWHTVTAALIMSLLLDHFGWFHMPVHTINPGRIVGALLMVGGISLISKF